MRETRGNSEDSINCDKYTENERKVKMLNQFVHKYQDKFSIKEPLI